MGRVHLDVDSTADTVGPDRSVHALQDDAATVGCHVGIATAADLNTRAGGPHTTVVHHPLDRDATAVGPGVERFGVLDHDPARLGDDGDVADAALDIDSGRGGTDDEVRSLGHADNDGAPHGVDRRYASIGAHRGVAFDGGLGAVLGDDPHPMTRRGEAYRSRLGVGSRFDHDPTVRARVPDHQPVVPSVSPTPAIGSGRPAPVHPAPARRTME